VPKKIEIFINYELKIFNKLHKGNNMKYQAGDQTKLLVVKHQDTTEIGRLLYPALEIITKSIEALFKLGNPETDSFYERLQLVINSEISYTKFQENLVQEQKTDKSMYNHLNILRSLFEQNKEIYNQEAFSNLSSLSPTSLSQYIAKVKTILSEHIRSICVQLKNAMIRQKSLNNPLYQDALRLLAKRKLPMKENVNRAVSYPAKHDAHTQVQEDIKMSGSSYPAQKGSS
jgi:hypothetical protein